MTRYTLSTVQILHPAGLEMKCLFIDKEQPSHGNGREIRAYNKKILSI